MPDCVGGIGACILTFNSRERILYCLEKTVAALAKGSRIVVVDNGSRDDTVALVRGRFPEVTVIETGRNLGYSAGNNVGAKDLAACGCEYLAFVNPDVGLERETLSALVQALEDDPQAACAGGVLHQTTGGVQPCFRGAFTMRAALTIYSNVRYLPIIRGLMRPILKREEARHYIAPETLRRGDAVSALSGGCVVFKKTPFFQAGGFDERSFLYCEEYMIADKLRALGFKMIAVPGAFYEHDGGASSANVTNSFLWRHYCVSEQVYVRDYLGWKRRAVILGMARAADNALCTALAFLRDKTRKRRDDTGHTA